jgi:DNA helicase II / ATP-dependent DNA helicase PcrA
MGFRFFCAMKHTPRGQLAIDFAPDFSPDQRQAIEHVDGPMLVVAGAGTGKTTVLVRRIVNLIRSGYARPDEILTVTYSENAAEELRTRVAAELGKNVALRASTFHAYAFGLLKDAGRSFDVVDNFDLFVYLRRRLHELLLKLFIKAATPGKFLNDLGTFFARCEDELVDVDQYEHYVEQVVAGKIPPPRTARSKDAEELPISDLIARCQEIAAVFRRVTGMLAENNLGTFGQMITGAVRLLEADPAALAQARKNARFILIDEFQDSNVAQIRLAKLLAGEEQNVFAVGDPDQAIYRFRGATTGAFEHFQRHFAGLKHVTLSENRRSLSPILRCSFQVIDRNPAVALAKDRQAMRLPLTSAREAEAKASGKKLAISPVEIVTAAENCNLAEAADIAAQIEAIRGRCPGHEIAGQMRPCRWSDFAVLYRQHTHREELVQECMARQIPVSVKGVNVLDISEVRDAFAGLCALQNSSDGISLVRLAALERFGIDGGELQAALNGAKENKDILPALEKVRGGAELIRSGENARAAAHKKDMDALACLRIVVDEFGIPKSPPVQALLDFIERWKKKPITETGQLTEFLEYLDFYLEAGGAICLDHTDVGAEDAVEFMSAHGAKGLEYPHVFIIRATTGSFPMPFKQPLFEFPQELRDPLTAAEGDPKEMHNQEERRLFYVAMTRARDTLAMYAKQGRGKKDPTPPGYLRELLQEKSIKDVVQQRSADLRVDITAAVAPASTLGAWFALPPRIPEQKLTLSATRLETYNKCPLKYKIETEWNIPDQPVPAMQFGYAVHTALKAYYDAVRAERPITRDALLTVFLEQLSISRFEDPLQLELYRKQGLQQLGDFFDLRTAEPVSQVLATEKFFQFEVAGVRVIGRMDRVDLNGDALIVTDYKTGSPRSEEDAEKSLQLSIYAAAAKKEWSSLPSSLRFYNLETNEAATTVRTEEQIRETEALICETAESIRAGQFDAKPGFHCKWCGFRTLCPATEERLYSIALSSAKAAN